MKLSLCMIVRDEIDQLDGCLDAAAPFVDELVVADTGSTDGTRERVAARADCALDVGWNDHFGEARNASLAGATGDWVLILDADERIVGDPARLRAGLAKTGALAWQLRVVSDLGGGRLEEFLAVRLFRRRPELRFTGRVHEQVTPALAAILAAEPGWSVAPLAGVRVDHSGYRAECMRARGKGERNARLLRRALADAPDDPYLHYKLFQALGPAHPEAEAHLERAARQLMACSASELRRQATASEALTAAAQGWLSRGQWEAALHACRRALEVLGPHPATRLVHGQALLASGRVEEALPEIERALAEPAPAGGFGFDRVAFEAAGQRLLCLARQSGAAR